MKKKTILIVDDEEDIRQILTFELEDAGFSVITAEGGDQGFSLLKEQEVDAVISDSQMPAGDGPQLLKNLRKLNPMSPPLFFLTGNGSTNLENAMNEGANGILAKPIREKNVIAALNKALLAKDKQWASDANHKDSREPIIIVRETVNQLTCVKRPMLGRGGLFVRGGQKLPKCGESINFEVRFEASHENFTGFSGKGEVRWVRSKPTEHGSAGFGMEFDTIYGKERLRIIEIIEAHKMVAFIPNT